MQSKNNMKRKGFTLVELLIVIVVIGILSAMMMLSSTEAVTSAKASNIVSNMRNLKTAALAYYVDNLDKFDNPTTTTTEGTPSTAAVEQDKVLSYLNNKDSISTNDGYSIETNGNGEWYVKYDLKKSGSTTEQVAISRKLAGRAKSIGLLKSAAETASSGTPESTTTSANLYVAEASPSAVFMRVR